MKTQTKEQYTFSVQFEGQPDRRLQLFAFAFDRQGRLLAKSSIKKNQGAFALSARTLRTSQIFIAPLPDGGFAERIDIPYLQRIQAFSPSINLSEDWQLPLIPEQTWRFWLWKLCPVRGRTVKPIFEDSTFLQAPVCEARVHICEVDRISLILPRIPDDIIFRLREDLLHPIPKPQLPPIPDPGPRIELPRNFLRLNGRGNFERTAIPAIEAVASQQVSQLTALPNALIQELQSPVSSQVRQAIEQNFRLIHPYLCLWPHYWPFFYRCDEIAVVATDANGRFDTRFWYQCFQDQPDLYFWVEYKVGSQWITVYRPPIACNTYWNYDCGDEITIRLTDPRVDACGDLYSPPGLAAVVEKIGNHAYIPKINQLDSTSIISNKAFREIGLTELGLNQNAPTQKVYRRPFGGTLPLYVHFSQQLIDNGVSHYRWAFRKREDEQGNPETSAWQYLEQEVFIKYRDNEGKKAFLLGPEPAYATPTYRIPPTNAVDLGMPNAANVQGYSLTDRFVSGWFNTAALADNGLYELRLELIRIQAGTPVIASVPPATFQIPEAISGSYSTYNNADAPASYLHPNPINLDEVSAFCFKIRIDNAPTTATLNVPEINGNTADPNCGFVPYPVDEDGNATRAAQLQLSFEAAHPRDFASFRMNLRRGNLTTPLPEASTVTPGQLYLVGRDWDGAKFGLQSDGDYDIAAIPVESILGGCDQAAFSMHLYVDALATNGSNPLNHLDRQRISSFAIEPEEPVPST